MAERVDQESNVLDVVPQGGVPPHQQAAEADAAVGRDEDAVEDLDPQDFLEAHAAAAARYESDDYDGEDEGDEGVPADEVKDEEAENDGLDPPRPAALVLGQPAAHGQGFMAEELEAGVVMPVPVGVGMPLLPLPEHMPLLPRPAPVGERMPLLPLPAPVGERMPLLPLPAPVGVPARVGDVVVPPGAAAAAVQVAAGLQPNLDQPGLLRRARDLVDDALQRNMQDLIRDEEQRGELDAQRRLQEEAARRAAAEEAMDQPVQPNPLEEERKRAVAEAARRYRQPTEEEKELWRLFDQWSEQEQDAAEHFQRFGGRDRLPAELCQAADRALLAAARAEADALARAEEEVPVLMDVEPDKEVNYRRLEDLLHGPLPHLDAADVFRNLNEVYGSDSDSDNELGNPFNMPRIPMPGRNEMRKLLYKHVNNQIDYVTSNIEDFEDAHLLLQLLQKSRDAIVGIFGEKWVPWFFSAFFF